MDSIIIITFVFSEISLLASGPQLFFQRMMMIVAPNWANGPRPREWCERNSKMLAKKLPFLSSKETHFVQWEAHVKYWQRHKNRTMTFHPTPKWWELYHM